MAVAAVKLLMGPSRAMLSLVGFRVGRCTISTNGNDVLTRTCALCGHPTNIIRSCRCIKGGGSVRNMSNLANAGDFLFRQLMDYKSYTYTYLLADQKTKEAILIDPVLEMVERDCRIVSDLGLHLRYAINTHVHADHITGSGEIKKHIPQCKSAIAEVSEADADVKVKHGDTLQFGQFKLESRSTPGHTNGCMTFVLHEKNLVFSGDAVLVRGCGRTDFQQGDAERLYESVHKQIFSLPENYIIFPAHDYTGQTMTTVKEEKTLNPRLTRSKQDFVKVMKDLNLPYPKQIDRSLPANMVCGLHAVSEGK